MTRPAMAILSALCVLMPAIASAFTPPDWRGQPESSYQDWRFDTAANPATPKTINNPYGSPTAAITVGELSTGWWDADSIFGTRQGYWDLGSGGTIQVVLPKTLYLEIWVEIVYCKDPSEKPAVTIAGATPASGNPEVEELETVWPMSTWYAERTKWIIPAGSSPGPVVITSDLAWGSIVDSLSIDTRGTVLTVSNIKITPIDSATAAVTWTTNIETVGSVDYRPIGSSAGTVISESTAVTTHSIQIIGLAAGVNYKVIVQNNGISEPPIYYPKPWPIPGDVNLDCTVNILDLMWIRDHINQQVSTGSNWKADVNEDNSINILDLFFVRNRLNTHCQ